MCRYKVGKEKMGRSKVFVGRLSDTDFVAYVSILISLIVYSFGVMVYESSGNSFKNVTIFSFFYAFDYLLFWRRIYFTLVGKTVYSDVSEAHAFANDWWDAEELLGLNLSFL